MAELYPMVGGSAEQPLAPYMPEPPPPEPEAAVNLRALRASPNLVDMLPESGEGSKAELAHTVLDEYQIDKESRKAWETRIKQAMDLAMLVAETKDYPFEGAANIKFPLLTTAALQFNARAYPAIVQGNRVVKCQTWGNDPQGQKAARAERVSEHMSYQLLAEDTAWEEDTDRIMVILPIVGCAFRKCWFDPAIGRNTSRLVTAQRLVVNYWARSLQDAPRVTEEMHLYPYEIAERIRSGRFIEFDYDSVASEDGSEDKDKLTNPQDKDAPHLFLEQHRLIDLDGDGYAEPYVVTVHHASQKVCRIVANWSDASVNIGPDGKVTAIRKRQYYVKYGFLPSPDGGFYDWGFGWLLKDITESINTTINQMLDAGHLSNVQGGLIASSAGIREKAIRLEMGEWRMVQTNQKLSDAMMPIKYDGPSAVLFNLLGLLVDAGKEVAAIKDVLTGEGQGKNASPTTTMALIEQGLQVFTSIYKRIHRALKAEFGIHAGNNREFLDPARYQQFFDGEQPVDPQADYSEADMDIMPVSDPSTVSKMQKLAKAEFIFQTSQGNPMVNQIEALMRLYQAAEIEEPEKLIQPPPPPDPETEMLMKMAAVMELDERQAAIMKQHASAFKDVITAMTSAIGQGDEAALARAQLQFNALAKEVDIEREMMNGQGRVPGMEGQPGNAMGAPAMPATGGFDQGAPVGGIVQPEQFGAAPGMGQPASAGGL